MSSLRSKQRQIARLEAMLQRGYKDVSKIGPSAVIDNLKSGFKIVRTTERQTLSVGQRAMLQSQIKGLQNRETFLWESVAIVPINDSEGRPIGSKRQQLNGTYIHAKHGKLEA